MVTEIGNVRKIEEKGLMWKTREVEFLANSDNDARFRVYHKYSIDRMAKNGEDVEEVYNQLREYVGKNQKVVLTYRQPLRVWPWRAKTRNLIQGVKPLESRLGAGRSNETDILKDGRGFLKPLL
ncbi:hypothetical protein H8D91_01130 [archaeon]|nr:hypothetical protein [archaeon]